MLINVLGQPRTGGPSAAAIPQSAVPLLAVLVMATSTGIHRDRVSELLWPEVPPAKQSRRLNTATWRLREAFDQESVVIVSPCGVMALAPDAVVDAAGLLSLIHRPPADIVDSTVEDLRAAAEVPVDDVFAGCFHDVVIRYRERLRSTQMRAVAALIERQREAEFLDSAIWWARRALEMDPYREDIHRRLISMLRAAGRPHEALAQFDRCCKILRDELGVEPMAETVRAASLFRDPTSPIASPVADRLIAEAEQTCRDAIAGLRTALRQLRDPVGQPPCTTCEATHESCHDLISE